MVFCGALFINTHYSGKFIHYNGFQQIIDVSPILLISIIAGALTWGIDQLMLYNNTNDISRILLGGIGGALSYTSMAYIFKFQSIQDLKIIILKQK